MNTITKRRFDSLSEQMSKASVQSTLLYVQFYNCVKKLHLTALFLMQMREKMNRYRIFLRFWTDSKITYFMNSNE
jgi:hypothetical protein